MKRKSDAFQRVSLQDRVAIQFYNQSLESRKKSPIYWSVFSFTHGAPSIFLSVHQPFCTFAHLRMHFPKSGPVLRRKQIGTSERRAQRKKDALRINVRKGTIHISHLKNYLNYLCPHLVNAFNDTFNFPLPPPP